MTDLIAKRVAAMTFFRLNNILISMKFRLFVFLKVI